MLKKIKSLIVFQFSILMDNKMVFVYSLIMPLAYLMVNLFSNSVYSFSDQQQINHLLPVIGYVCITGVLNGWVMGILVMRENNFLKMFTSIIGDKRYIFFSNYVIGLFSIIVQVFLIVITYQIFSKSMSYKVLLIAFITTIVMTTVVSLVSSIFLMMKMKYSSIPMILTTYILLGFLVSGLQPSQLFLRIIFNIVDMYSLTRDVGNLLFHLNEANTYSVLIVIIPILTSIIIGIRLIDKIPVSSIHVRV